LSIKLKMYYVKEINKKNVLNFNFNFNMNLKMKMEFFDSQHYEEATKKK